MTPSALDWLHKHEGDRAPEDRSPVATLRFAMARLPEVSPADAHPSADYRPMPEEPIAPGLLRLEIQDLRIPSGRHRQRETSSYPMHLALIPDYPVLL